MVRFITLLAFLLTVGANATALAYDSSTGVRIKIKAGNIFIERSGHPRQLTERGMDSDAVLSPDGKFIVFTRSKSRLPPDDCSSGSTADQLRRINVDGAGDQVLVAGHAGSAPQEQVCMFDQKQFTSDGSLLFFLSPAWVTSSALHVFDFKQGEVRYVAPANVVIVFEFLHG